MKSSWDVSTDEPSDDLIMSAYFKYDSNSSDRKPMVFEQYWCCCDKNRCHNHEDHHRPQPLWLTVIPVVQASSHSACSTILSKPSKLTLPSESSSNSASCNLASGSNASNSESHGGSGGGGGGATDTTTTATTTTTTSSATPFFTAHVNLMPNESTTAAYNTLFWSTRLNIPSINIKLINSDGGGGSNNDANSTSVVDDRSSVFELYPPPHFDQQSTSSSQQQQQAPQYYQATFPRNRNKYLGDSVTLDSYPKLLHNRQYRFPYQETNSDIGSSSSDLAATVSAVTATAASNTTNYNWTTLHHLTHQLTLADRKRYERLFSEIDVDGNGVIDFDDLLYALERKGIKASHDNVKHLILRSDTNLDGDIDFAEFVTYCLENEKQLRIIFNDIDINDDDKIDTDELITAFQRIGVKVDKQEVLKLVKRINPENDELELNFEEFRDYLLLHPTDSLHDLMKSWRHGTFVDLGEDGLMPVDFNENEIQSGMWWRHLLAGGMAGAVSRTSTAPLDRLKVFLQVRGAEFNGLGICLRHMIQEGGVISLWRGNGINVLKIAPETAIKFMAFDQLKRWIHSNKAGEEITIMERFVSGSLAGAISQTVIYPMEVLKTRFCLRSTGQYAGLFDAAQKIHANGGIKNFYRGYVPNLIGIIPYAGIDLTIYETLKKMYLKHNSLEEAPIFVCLTCGTISSTFGQIASYPLALVRTRMQSETGNHRSSMLGMFRTIYAREGFRGLYRGITANIMKVAPAVSISYVVYEYARRPLGAIMS